MKKVLVIGLLAVFVVSMLSVAALGAGGVNEGPTIDGSGCGWVDQGEDAEEPTGIPESPEDSVNTESPELDVLEAGEAFHELKEMAGRLLADIDPQCWGEGGKSLSYSFPCGGQGQPPCVDQCCHPETDDCPACPPSYFPPPSNADNEKAELGSRGGSAGVDRITQKSAESGHLCSLACSCSSRRCRCEARWKPQ